MIPVQKESQLSLKTSPLQGDYRQGMYAFLLDSSNHAFDHRKAALLSNRAEALPDPAATAPFGKSFSAELLALIGNQMPRRFAETGHHTPKDVPHLFRRRRLSKDGQAMHATGKTIHDHRQPPTERPALRQRQRRPRRPEACRCRHCGEIDVPDVIGVSCGDSAGRWHGLGKTVRSKCRWLSTHATDRARCQVQSGSGQDLGRFDFAQSGAQDVQTLHERADEIRELVHRWMSLQQCLWSLFIEAFHPRHYRRCSEMEDACGLSQRPATGRTQLEDGETFGGKIMRPLRRRDSSQASVLDPTFFAKESNFMFPLIDARGQANALVAAAGGPTSGGHEGEMGQRHDLEHGCLHGTRPLLGQRRPRTA